jgi:lipid-A-disaccharide synthase
VKRLVYFSAGEASGDALGAELIAELTHADNTFELRGLGGPKMASATEGGIEDWIEDAAVVGLWEVLKRYPWFKRRFHAFVEKILKDEPAAVILVDYPGFNLRLAAALRRDGYRGRIIYYISPQVWAWNRGRIPRMARWLDLMLCIFPFEKDLYEQSGLRTEFIGHPALDRLEPMRTGEPRTPNLVGLFPGSREREVKKILPVMVEAADRIKERVPEAQFEIAAASNRLLPLVQEIAGNRQGFTVSTAQAYNLMQRAEVGMIASGTATLEAAIFGLPYALLYKVSTLTYLVGKLVINVPYLGIVNILAGREVVREFVQTAAQPGAVAQEMLRLMQDTNYRHTLEENLRQVITMLGQKGGAGRAARHVIDTLREGHAR